MKSPALSNQLLFGSGQVLPKTNFPLVSGSAKLGQSSVWDVKSSLLPTRVDLLCVSVLCLSVALCGSPCTYMCS